MKIPLPFFTSTRTEGGKRYADYSQTDSQALLLGRAPGSKEYLAGGSRVPPRTARQVNSSCMGAKAGGEPR